MHTLPGGGEYYGEVSARGDIEGQGEFTDSEGNRYVGGFAGGCFEGVGVYFSSGGEVLAGSFAEGEEVGEGVSWSADRSEMHRLIATPGEASVERQEISAAEAAEIAARLGVPVPPF